VLLDRLQQQVQIVAELRGPEVFTDRLQRLLGRLLAGEATPGPVLPFQQIARSAPFGLRLAKPIFAPLRHPPVLARRANVVSILESASGG
jgi:hypothetical protein